MAELKTKENDADVFEFIESNATLCEKLSDINIVVLKEK